MKSRINNLTLCALFTAMIAVCAQLTIPFAVPFTMQSFAIYLSLLCIGAKRTAASTLCYLALGILGVPVFSAFRGGVQVLFQISGGFLIGFLLMIGVFAFLLRCFPKGNVAVCLFAATLPCYALAVVWYFLVLGVKANYFSVMKAFACCVFPFLIPDVLKILLAVTVSKKVKKLLPILR
ncbi:MAG: biotin transporter BioY [Oscillospiraceae bacterium]|nr:biotin transporter BioY [Oscillospiraceae bacterium]